MSTTIGARYIATERHDIEERAEPIATCERGGDPAIYPARYPLIERLSAPSLSALAFAAGRTVGELIECLHV